MMLKKIKEDSFLGGLDLMQIDFEYWFPQLRMNICLHNFFTGCSNKFGILQALKYIYVPKNSIALGCIITRYS